MGCSSTDCSSAGSTLTYPDILQHNFTFLHSNKVGFFAFKREQNYLQNDTKFIVICFVLPEIFYFKQKINKISVTAPSYLTYLFINCDQLCILQKRDLYLNQFSNKKGAIGKSGRPKKHPIWAAHPRTNLSTKYPPGPLVRRISSHKSILILL